MEGGEDQHEGRDVAGIPIDARTGDRIVRRSAALRVERDVPFLLFVPIELIFQFTRYCEASAQRFGGQPIGRRRRAAGVVATTLHARAEDFAGGKRGRPEARRVSVRRRSGQGRGRTWRHLHLRSAIVSLQLPVSPPRLSCQLRGLNFPDCGSPHVSNCKFLRSGLSRFGNCQTHAWGVRKAA